MGEQMKCLASEAWRSHEPRFTASLRWCKWTHINSAPLTSIQNKPLSRFLFSSFSLSLCLSLSLSLSRVCRAIVKNTAVLSASQWEPVAYTHRLSLPHSPPGSLSLRSTRARSSPPHCICPPLPEVRYHASSSLLLFSACQSPFQGPFIKQSVLAAKPGTIEAALLCHQDFGDGTRLIIAGSEDSCRRRHRFCWDADLCGTSARCLTPLDPFKVAAGHTSVKDLVLLHPCFSENSLCVRTLVSVKIWMCVSVQYFVCKRSLLCESMPLFILFSRRVTGARVCPWCVCAAWWCSVTLLTPGVWLKRLSRGSRVRKTPQVPTTPGRLPDKNLPDTLRRSKLKEASEIDFVNRSGLTRNKRETSVWVGNRGKVHNTWYRSRRGR